jgi:tripartite-type tricarboxylate transporter receptor subunit TctC
MNRRQLLQRALTASAALTVGAPEVVAQRGFPERTLRLVVPFPPGGPYDVIGRLYARKMSEVLGQTMVVENKAGGETSIGAAEVARANPDGYTLLMGGSPTHVFAPAIMANPPYDAIKDFAPLAITGVETLSIIVKADSPIKSLNDLERLAKASPGKLNYGDTAPSAQLAVEMFKSQAGNLNIVGVPYRGFTPAFRDLLAGHIELMPSLVGSAANFQKQGTVRILGVFSDKRLPSVPDVPTGVESGYPNLVLWTFSMLCTTAGTPAPVIERLHQATQKVLHDPEFIKFQEDRGIQPVLDSSPQAAAKFLDKQIKELTPTIIKLRRKG